MRRTTLLSCGLFFGVSLFLAGCGDSYGGRLALSGKVTAEGKPLKKGLIKFEPLDKANGSATGAPIEDGVYEIKRMNGLKPGTYLVRITAGDGLTPPNVEEAGNPGGSTNIISFDVIPPDFGAQSKKQVEVKDGGPNEFNFDIPKLLVAPVKRR